MRRRTALKGAAAGVAAIAGGVARPDVAGAAVPFKELRWFVGLPGVQAQPVRTRVISGIPASARYGEVVTAGPVIVQVICEYTFTAMMLAAGCRRVSVTGQGQVVVADSRGLSGLFPVGFVFPDTALPEKAVEFIMTGTAKLSDSGPLPAVRNVGPVTIAPDPVVTARVSYLKGDKRGEFDSEIQLKPGQDPVVATIDVQ
ncbi:hypothetical protein [Amycolatopsis samaneae]|uniref:Twin-arginine translocation signal domain-containing protein n=1 Tax=Amycolatopsis samaneae TaxID=664691 RepID=A0ABW5G970_9PSEU